MPTRVTLNLNPFTVDKEKLRRFLAEGNGRPLLPDGAEPTMTPKQLRTRMQAMGVVAEDNIGSCGIIAARNEE